MANQDKKSEDLSKQRLKRNKRNALIGVSLAATLVGAATLGPAINNFVKSTFSKPQQAISSTLDINNAPNRRIDSKRENSKIKPRFRGRKTPQPQQPIQQVPPHLIPETKFAQSNEDSIANVQLQLAREDSIKTAESAKLALAQSRAREDSIARSQLVTIHTQTEERVFNEGKVTLRRKTTEKQVALQTEVISVDDALLPPEILQKTQKEPVMLVKKTETKVDTTDKKIPVFVFGQQKPDSSKLHEKVAPGQIALNTPKKLEGIIKDSLAVAQSDSITSRDTTKIANTQLPESISAVPQLDPGMTGERTKTVRVEAKPAPTVITEPQVAENQVKQDNWFDSWVDARYKDAIEIKSNVGNFIGGLFSNAYKNITTAVNNAAAPKEEHTRTKVARVTKPRVSGPNQATSIKDTTQVAITQPDTVSYQKSAEEILVTREYKVARGENLCEIVAQNYQDLGINKSNPRQIYLEALRVAAYNNIADADHIPAGKAIKLYKHNTNEHIVVKGEHLDLIAVRVLRQNGIRPTRQQIIDYRNEISEQNKIDNPDQIDMGQNLRLPPLEKIGLKTKAQYEQFSYNPELFNKYKGARFVQENNLSVSLIKDYEATVKEVARLYESGTKISEIKRNGPYAWLESTDDVYRAVADGTELLRNEGQEIYFKRFDRKLYGDKFDTWFADYIYSNPNASKKDTRAAIRKEWSMSVSDSTISRLITSINSQG